MKSLLVFGSPLFFGDSLSMDLAFGFPDPGVLGNYDGFISQEANLGYHVRVLTKKN